MHAIFPPGTTTLHEQLEECVADFVGKPAAIVFGMGYVTNSAILPVIMGKVCTYNLFILFINKSCMHFIFSLHFSAGRIDN